MKTKDAELKPKAISPPTTAQSLGSLLKSARDIMRKDKGLNGDLDRLPMRCSAAVLGCGFVRRLATCSHFCVTNWNWQRDAAFTRRRGRLRYDLMPMPKLTPQHPTTAQFLGSLPKSARDIMRKDKGLNGDLDRLPMRCSAAVLGCGFERRLAACSHFRVTNSDGQRDAAFTRRRGRLRYGHG